MVKRKEKWKKRERKNGEGEKRNVIKKNVKNESISGNIHEIKGN